VYFPRNVKRSEINNKNTFFSQKKKPYEKKIKINFVINFSGNIIAVVILLLGHKFPEFEKVSGQVCMLITIIRFQ